jgi:hypothetical protein
MEEQVMLPLDVLDAAGNPQGQSFTISDVALGAPIGVSPSAYNVPYQVPGWSESLPLSDGLVLDGATLDRASVKPGDSLFIGLRWRTTEAIETTRTTSLALVQGSLVATQTMEVGGRYPVTRWSAGETMVTYHRMDIPGGLREGTANVVLRWHGGEVLLDTIRIAASEHLFEPPPIEHEVDVAFDRVARLLGYDLPQTTFRAGEPVTVTLYWEALPGAHDADYVVFTHLLDDQHRLVAQHDGRAVMGTRPSQGWVAGEILVDPHPMAFREPYTGPASIEVGLYRANDLGRVVSEIGSDAVILPTSPTIVPR